MSEDNPSKTLESNDFIREAVAEDLASGRAKYVMTRYPPEPNGWLHIGHAKALSIDFGVAEQYGGKCNLRFDDTNPEKEDMSYVESIKKDIAWLGYDWEDREYYASDYYEKLYDLAIKIVKKGHAYVDDLNDEEIREYRGTNVPDKNNITLTPPGKNSPWREREASRRTSISSPGCARANSPTAPRPSAPRSTWPTQPAHARSGHVSHPPRAALPHGHGLVHLSHVRFPASAVRRDRGRDALAVLARVRDSPPAVRMVHPRGRGLPVEADRVRAPQHLAFRAVKRWLLRLVQEGHVSGWDDPRMPTLSGLRRRGYTAASIRDFMSRIGVAKTDSLVDVQLLEHCIREELNKSSDRAMAVQRPLRLVVENWPDG